MSTVVNSIAQFNNAYLNYLLRNDEPLTDVVYAQALMFASRHSGRPLSEGTIVYINRVLAVAALAADADRVSVENIRTRVNAISAVSASAAWHSLFLAACRIPA